MFVRSLWVLYTLSLLFFFTHAYADWNQDFDEQTKCLIDRIPQFQNPHYLEEINFFRHIRGILLKDKAVVHAIKNSLDENKLMIHKKNLGIILKKRRGSGFKDLYPYELSYLTNSRDFITASFPVEIGGKIVIVQKAESFVVGPNSMSYDKKYTSKVSLTIYWKALIQAYLCGIDDLVATNIGINDQYVIRFFDNEACLNFGNTPSKRYTHTNLMMIQNIFHTQAFDWQQYEEPLSKRAAHEIHSYVHSFLDNFEQNAKLYFQCRAIYASEGELAQRIDLLRNFQIHQGTSFRDFIIHLYPRLSSGLNHLSKLVSKAWKVRVGHGSSLFFIIRKMAKFPMHWEDEAAIQKWIERYAE